MLDLFHVLKRLRSAPPCFHSEGGTEATTFVSHRLTMLLEGKLGHVL